ncbi:MAG: carbohydrate kinase family protein [Roseateles sp.]|uniref:carbohydrate kinase family protein n=1 Tax=Roseateles sp. TaxID=1971397 RepID=UPI0040362F86
MFVVCGEALFDVFEAGDTRQGLTLDARIGGSPLNVAIGLARLGQPVSFLGALSRGFLGDRLRRALQAEGVSLSFAPTIDAPTTLGLVGLDASGSASYVFYGDGCADRELRPEHLPALGDEVRALHFGSYSMVVEPAASTHRQLIERERAARVIAYDPNLRLNVEPDLARWRDTVAWMAQRAHLMKVSEEDLALLHPGIDAQQVAAQWLASGAGVVVVTQGGQGATAFHRQGQVYIEARTVQVEDTVGAGDTFQAAMLAWLAEQSLLMPQRLATLSPKQLRTMLVFASDAAALTCSRRGADMPRRTELGAAS